MLQFYNVCCHRYVNYNTRYGERRAYRRVPCGGEKSLKIVSMFVSLPLPHISRSLSSSCWVLSLHICTTTPCQQPGTSPSGRWIGGFCYGPALWSSCGSRIGMMRRTIAAQLEWHLTLEFHDTHIKTRDFTCKDNNLLWNRTTTSQVGKLQCTVWYGLPNEHIVPYDTGSVDAVEHPINTVVSTGIELYNTSTSETEVIGIHSFLH